MLRKRDFLTVLAALIFLTAARLAGTEGIENPRCELIRPGLYRITYQASPHSGHIRVFASSRPDRIDSPRPLLKTRKSPVDVLVPEESGRIYFHLRPASGPTRVVALRRLPLDGARNFRDVGGYRTADGHYVKWGLVYRSNYLAKLTSADYEYLKSLRIAVICDIRASLERMRFPTRWIGPSPEFLNLPVGPARDGTLTLAELKQKVDSINSQNNGRGYDYAISGAEQYGEILHRIAAGDLPLVEHDTSGKDRAGLFAAILLTAVGVPRDVVIQDYLLTTQYMLAPEALQSTTADLQNIFGLPEPLDARTVRAIMTTHAETLEATFDTIEKTFGSFENYLRDALKISDDDLAIIRERLLER